MSVTRTCQRTDRLVCDRRHTIAIILSRATIKATARHRLLHLVHVHYLLQNQDFVTTALGLQRNPSKLAHPQPPRVPYVGAARRKGVGRHSPTRFAAFELAFARGPWRPVSHYAQVYYNLLEPIVER